MIKVLLESLRKDEIIRQQGEMLKQLMTDINREREKNMLKPFVRVNIDTISVNKNETLTVYLENVKNTETAKRSGYIQVELRVSHDGVPEIFCDDVEVKGFNMWYPCS